MCRKLVIIVSLLITMLVLGACAPAAEEEVVTEEEVAPALSPAPAEFKLVSLDITPPEVIAVERVSITAVVKNTGGSEGTYTVALTIDGVKAQAKVVKIAPRATETVSFTVAKDEPGTYNVQVNDFSGTFRVLKPAEFTISNLLITPHIVEAGQTVTVTANVTNVGEVEGSYSVTLQIDGVQVETKEVMIASATTETISFTFSEDTTGSYNVEVGGLSGLLVVMAPGSALAQLGAAYPEVLQELVKLPELRGMDEEDNEAIEDIAYLASNPKYKPAFESMLDEGIRDKRKYCTPLQALLWVAYDREFDGSNPLNNYSLANLINDAWSNTTTSKNFTSEKWQDFDEVVDRLNSPRLVSIYMINNIAYDYEEAKNVPHRFAPPRDTFLRRKGICNEQARFALYCLLNNGYDYDNFEAKDNATCMLGIDIDTLRGHDVCLFKEKSLFYTIDNGWIRGPFGSVEIAADSTAVRVNIAPWNKYFFRDTDLRVTKVVRAEK